MTEKPRKDSDVVALENSDAKSNESSGVVSVSDLDSLFFDPSDSKDEVEAPSSLHLGTVIIIEDVAFVM